MYKNCMTLVPLHYNFSHFTLPNKISPILCSHFRRLAHLAQYFLPRLVANSQGLRHAKAVQSYLDMQRIERGIFCSKWSTSEDSPREATFLIWGCGTETLGQCYFSGKKVQYSPQVISTWLLIRCWWGGGQVEKVLSTTRKKSHFWIWSQYNKIAVNCNKIANTF